MAKIICIDFDGVIHSYTSPWQDVDIIPDPPVPGALKWLIQLCMDGDFEPHIYSSRSKTERGISAMREWIFDEMEKAFTLGAAQKYIKDIQFAAEKPPAYLTIDDRAICFRGTFPSRLEMDNFRPWNK